MVENDRGVFARPDDHVEQKTGDTLVDGSLLVVRDLMKLLLPPIFYHCYCRRSHSRLRVNVTVHRATVVATIDLRTISSFLATVTRN